MQNRLLSFLTVFFITPHALAQEGYWEGNINNKDKQWKVAIDFEKKDGKVKASVYFIDVNGYNRLFSVTKNNSTLHLERAQPNGKAIKFDGILLDHKIIVK